MHKLEDAVDLYTKNNELTEIINKVNNDNTLCIHIRSGDMGIIEDMYTDKIINIIRQSKIDRHEKKHELRKILLSICSKKLLKDYLKTNNNSSYKNK